MKKTLLFLALLATVCARAQFVLDSIENHSPLETGTYEMEPAGLMEMQDGTLLSRIHLYGMDNSGYPSLELGLLYYKLTREACIVDSLFVETSNYPMVVTVRRRGAAPANCAGQNVQIEQRLDDDGSRLNFVCFDDDLNFCDSAVQVVLSDTAILIYYSDFLHDSEDDLIIHYSILSRHENHFVRFDLNGNLKNHVVIPESEMPVLWRPRGLRQFSQSPPLYDFWGTKQSGAGALISYVLDSAFHIVSCDTVYPVVPTPPYSCFGFQDRALHLDDGSLILLVRYRKLTGNDMGVLAWKLNPNMQTVAYRYFKTIPTSTHSAVPIDLRKTSDGHILAAYSTRAPYQNQGFISVVEMDENLDIVWQRFCMYSGMNRTRWGFDLELLDDGTIVLDGKNFTYDDGNVAGYFFMALSNTGVAVSEKEIIVRPYAYYPNPAQDELRLQYSPDVKPTQIELFDIQGRLVRSQRNGLERLNLQGLPAGTYTMRVTLEGGKVFSDKVIKE